MNIWLIRRHGGDYLVHHGIKGQHWGVRNGPPYPLNRVKSGSVRRKNLDKMAGRVNNITEVEEHGQANVPFRRLSSRESISDTVTKANPYGNRPEYRNNCTACSIASFMRQKGYDVIARDTDGCPQILSKVVTICFKKASAKSGVSTEFTSSKSSAANMLVKMYGNNADGVCSVEWKYGGSHAFNWTIKNGNVAFYDGQLVSEPADVHKQYWKSMKYGGVVRITRLDDLEINENGISQYVENG